MRPSFAWLAPGLAALALLAACKGEGPKKTAGELDGGPPPHPPVYRPLETRPVVDRLEVQMAWNADDGLLYGRLRFDAPRGTRDRFWRFEDGAWRLRGTPRRESFEEGEVLAAEQSLAIAWNNPAVANDLPNFGLLGCMLACHDGATFQPDWSEDGLDLETEAATMRLPDTAFYSGSGLDLWQWGAQTSGHGYWLDQVLDTTLPQDGDARRPDPAGTTPWTENPLVDGHPAFVYDPATTAGGRFAVPSAELADSPDFLLEDASAPAGIDGLVTPKSLAWDEAALQGYVPREGDTVPATLLRAPDGSNDDVLAVLSPDAGGTSLELSRWEDGVWTVVFTRALSTGSIFDHAFAEGDQVDVGFALHTGESIGRDHYVSLPLTVWIEEAGNPNGGIGSDYTVTRITGAGLVPDFDDTSTFPILQVDLFLPGVVSWEFLTDTRDADFLFGQRHGGADSLVSALNGPAFTGCEVCHVVREDDPDAGVVIGGPLELRTPRRGGLFEATPLSFEANVQPVLETRCGSCHAPGGVAQSLPFSGVPDTQVYENLVATGHVDWRRPPLSNLLQIPAADLDGNHPASGPLAGFDGSQDLRRILYWLLYDAPEN